MRALLWPMQDYQLFLTDDRSAVRGVSFVVAVSAAAVRAIAQRLMDEPHHREVEVWRGDCRLFAVSPA